ncbi:MAG: hypothetical protein AAFP81_12400 [Pseudomonadota bacterium]
MHHFFGLILAAASAVTACTGISGSGLRSVSDDVQGPLIEDCRNLRREAIAKNDPFTYYHTTFWSAAMEGATEGANQSLADRGYLELNRSYDNTVQNKTPFTKRSYCAVFKASFTDLSKITALTMPMLKSNVAISNIDNGYFVTSFAERRHKGDQGKPVTPFNPVWREQFFVGVEAIDDTWTGVRVSRKVMISREPGVYNIGASSGHNETWFLNRLRENLGLFHDIRYGYEAPVVQTE